MDQVQFRGGDGDAWVHSQVIDRGHCDRPFLPVLQCVPGGGETRVDLGCHVCGGRCVAVAGPLGLAQRLGLPNTDKSGVIACELRTARYYGMLADRLECPAG